MIQGRDLTIQAKDQTISAKDEANEAKSIAIRAIEGQIADRDVIIKQKDDAIASVKNELAACQALV